MKYFWGFLSLITILFLGIKEWLLGRDATQTEAKITTVAQKIDVQNQVIDKAQQSAQEAIDAFQKADQAYNDSKSDTTKPSNS